MFSDKFLVIIATLFVGIASASDYVDVLKKKRLNRNKRALKNKNDILDNEDVVFWTRLMLEGRVGSLPVESGPPVGSGGGGEGGSPSLSPPPFTPFPTPPAGGSLPPVGGGSLPPAGGGSLPPVGGGSLPPVGGGSFIPTGGGSLPPFAGTMPTYAPAGGGGSLPPVSSTTIPDTMPPLGTIPPATMPPPPTPPAFNCPPATLVGCTAPDPSAPEDECEVVGEPCASNGEFCCPDACPRKYCTAKEA